MEKKSVVVSLYCSKKPEAGPGPPLHEPMSLKDQQAALPFIMYLQDIRFHGIVFFNSIKTEEDEQPGAVLYPLKTKEPFSSPDCVGTISKSETACIISDVTVMEFAPLNIPIIYLLL
jgi:hypothetical protein